MQEKKCLVRSPRVLDLTNMDGYLCGRILADLGADVVKVEKPGGDPGRRIGPFYQQTPNHERSLFWLAYNANKRSITLNLDSGDGRHQQNGAGSQGLSAGRVPVSRTSTDSLS